MGLNAYLAPLNTTKISYFEHLALLTMLIVGMVLSL